MKRLILGVAVLTSASVAGPAFAATWNLDDMHTDVGFTVRHMMVSNVRGAFPGVKGMLDWDEKDVTKSKVEITVDAATVDTRVKTRDDDLRGPSFFDVTKYPTISFKSTKIKKDGKKLKVSGDLTIRDMTKPVTLAVEGPMPGFKDPFGKTRTGIMATGKISRKEFGLTYSKALETGGMVISDDVNIEISAEFTRADAASPPAPAAAANPPPKT